METQRYFRHKTRGLGINNFIKNLTAIRPGSWDAVLKIFKLIIAGSKLTKYPVLGDMYKYIMFFKPEHRATESVVMNLSAKTLTQKTICVEKDFSDKNQSVIMPVDIMKNTVKNASYIAKMNRCICRDAQDCKTYPHDLGCLFVGPGAMVLVERKIGKKISVEDAIEHIEKAASLGLIGQSLWIEVEQYIWGIKDEDMDRFLELCFCCPCCCTALKIAKNSTRDVKRRFRSAGWKASVNNDICTKCVKCVPVCPVEAINEEEGSIIINTEFCMGCGLCATKCPSQAITIKLYSKPENECKDYFKSIDLEL